MNVEIWSDVVCPWCYIGKRRFETALSQFAHRDDVELVWRSFELDPTAPAIRTEDTAAHLAAKYGMSREQAKASQDRLVKLGAEDGLEYRFDISRSGNTFDGHRLLHLAHELGVQDAAKERLFRAYFTEGEAIGDPTALTRLLAEVGVPETESRAVLESDRYADAVRADENEARELGINGVPFFVVERRYGVSGAQPADVLLQVLERAWAESHPTPQLISVGAGASDTTCTDETCAI
ncbi:MAG TPA: DsbA family oxidoreductase [Chloroflexota bacterium]|jgi:predicted DsbA family dithiol-disulfide isomerase|nr:DsbA family oxidoreductase [Chloroflexota bacterium]